MEKGMNPKESHYRAYDWDAVVPIRIGLRSRELVDRSKWFINMRWVAVVLCVSGAALATIEAVPALLNPYYFGSVAAFLAVMNTVYFVMARALQKREHAHRRARQLLLIQMLADFAALGVLTYACGSIETPIVALFLAHIILATLFFSPRISRSITAIAWLMASLPLILEWAGVLPVMSIIDSDFKEVVTGSGVLNGTMVVVIGGVFFVCWYLVQVITKSLKIREKQLEKAHQMLLTLDREKTQTTVRATHELKAPFAAIKSYVYTLRDGYCGELPERAEKVVGRIGERCDQLTEKITDIIYLSNVKSLVVTETNLHPVDIGELLQGECKEGDLLGEPRSISVKCEIPPGSALPVNGSRPHLKTLFSNLIRNAVQYSLDGGEVSVRTEAVGGRVTVYVRDSGIGIVEENLEKIFNEHFRSNAAVKHHAAGTGLGLTIVKEVAKLHGATVEVTSEANKWTEFAIHFDLVENQIPRGQHG